MLVQNTDPFVLQNLLCLPLNHHHFCFHWCQWPTMATYIQASECDWAMDFPTPTISMLPSKDNHNFYIAWTKVNSTILGLIKLHLSESLRPSTKGRTLLRTSSRPSRMSMPLLGSLVHLHNSNSSWAHASHSPLTCQRWDFILFSI